MAQIPYLYRKLLNIGVPADIAAQVADTDYEGTVTTNLGDLADVNVTGVTDGETLTYDDATDKWVAS